MEILEVAIGLFSHLVLSFVVTAANEMSAAWFRRRAWMLRKGITQLLNDDDLAARFYDHPLIQVCPRRQACFRGFRCCKASSVAGRRTSNRGRSRSRSSMWCRANRALRAGAAGDGVRRTLALLEREAGGDPVKFRANVETWFNDSMERVSGWYRRARSCCCFSGQPPSLWPPTQTRWSSRKRSGAIPRCASHSWRVPNDTPRNSSHPTPPLSS